jgi:hypothetical protein
MVDLLVKAEAQAIAVKEDSGAAVVIQSRYRGFKVCTQAIYRCVCDMWLCFDRLRVITVTEGG